MAQITVAQASERELKSQGIKSTQNIEWIKVTASSSTTGEGNTYAAKKIRSYVGVINAGPFSVTVSGTTVTVTPVATCSGIFFIGLLGAITE